MQWKWCTRSCKFELLITNKEDLKLKLDICSSGRGEAEDDVCSRLNDDRAHLIHCLEDGSIFAWEKLNWLWPWRCFFQFARDGVGEAFGTILKQRLTIETFVSFNSASTSFKIDHLDLKCFEKLSKGGSKKLYRGEWLGQEAAIAMLGSRSGEILDLENLVKREAEFLLKLQHPNIVVCYGYSYTHDAPWPANKQGPTSAGYLVLELMEEANDI